MDIDVQSLSQSEKNYLLLETVCAKQENLPKVKELIAAGASVEAMNYDNNKTVLMYAAYKGHINIVKFLLENNANVNFNACTSSFGNNALRIAFVVNSPIEIFQLLLEKGADFNEGVITKGYSVFGLAKECYNKNPEYVNCILNTMTYSEVEEFSTQCLRNSKIVSDFLIYNRKKLFSIILLNDLESKLIPELTKYILEILASNVTASNSSKHLSKWYIASPYFKQDIDFFVSYLREKREKAQRAQQAVLPSVILTKPMTLDHISSSLQDVQDNDVLFSQETSDLAPQIPSVIFSEEPKRKSCSEMIVEGFTVAEEGFFSIFNQGKRKRNGDESEENQDGYSNPNKKRKMI